MDTGTETNMSVNWVNFNSHPLMTVMKLNEENWKLKQAWVMNFSHCCISHFDFSSHYFEKNWGTCVHFSVKCVFQQKIATFQN
jgi:hypothetical protein